MGAIVNVTVSNETSAVQESNFQNTLIVSLNGDHNFELVVDPSAITDQELAGYASSYLGSGASSVYVAGKAFDPETITTESVFDYLNGLEKNGYYGVVVIPVYGKESNCFEAIKQFTEGNKKLAILEMTGNVTTIIDTTAQLNSDRIGFFANSKTGNEKVASAVSGKCFPKPVGSLTWGNQQVNANNSEYSLSDEVKLMEQNVNYITSEMGLLITQFGRTLSGSNLDVTRSSDWLQAKVKENVTGLLIRVDKIPYTNQGISQVTSAISEIGEQAITQGIAEDYYVSVPNKSEIPKNDIANRVLKNCKLVITLAGAIETVEVNITVEL